MERHERFHKLDQLLREYGVVSRETLMEELGVSLATFKRDLEYMRERFYAPIVWDKDAGGYKFDKPDPYSSRYELPGLWFNAGEVYALLTMRHLLTHLQPGLLEPHIQPLLSRLEAMLDEAGATSAEIDKRIFILHATKRSLDLEHFQVCANAVLSRKRLHIRHFSRQTGEESEREVSPQRLVHYRDNWYLDTWCHLKEGIRSFSVDALRKASVLEKKAKDIARKELDEVLAAGYGIFGGKEVTWAKLRFTPERARWVASETWHPQQKSHFDEEGFYILELPYSDPRELVMDILRHGSAVEVLAPESLRQSVRQEVQSMLRAYSR